MQRFIKTKNPKKRRNPAMRFLIKMIVSNSRAYQEYKTFRRNQRGEARGYHQGNFFRVYDDKPDVLITTPRRIGLNHAEEFRREIKEYIKSYEGDITIDVKNLIEPDSALVAILTAALTAEKRKGRQIKLVNAQNRLKALVEIHHLTSLAQCFA